MRIYLAARYSRREELCGYRGQLEDAGHAVTSRWLDGDHQIDASGKPIGEHGESLVEAGDDAGAAQLRQHLVTEDCADVRFAHCVVSFTEAPRSPRGSRGGRHVEFGMAVALGKRLVVVGHRENLFHWLPEVEFFETWDEALAALAEGAAIDDGRRDEGESSGRSAE